MKAISSKGVGRSRSLVDKKQRISVVIGAHMFKRGLQKKPTKKDDKGVKFNNQNEVFKPYYDYVNFINLSFRRMKK